MQKITVKGDKGYYILLEAGILKESGRYIRNISKATRAIVISDSNVFPIYGDAVLASLCDNGFEVSSFVFPAGERSKTVDTVLQMTKAMSEAELTRADIAVALGGGVTGDMVGFASSIYLRGIDFVQIPTTLLSQVDSSVGGKTGCDTDFGKNLLGAFHNPSLVLIDTDTLKTLPEHYMRDGMGEVIKYGCIKSAPLFEKLMSCKDIADIMNEVIYECVDIKRKVVENDFTEKGERMLLNFGHTLAHAIEKYYNYEKISHGQAVGIGMYMITLAAERENLTEKGTAEKIKTALEKYGLPISCEVKAAELCVLMTRDKKRRGNSLNLVLLQNIGNAYVKRIENDRLEAFFSEV